MKSNIIADLVPLIESTDGLKLLPGNARKGHLESIAAALREFGQHVPIVVQHSTDTILKGNNTYRAATEILGWEEIAVVRVDDDDQQAIARALIDNRTSDLGSYDEKLRSSQVVEVAEFAPDVFDAAGWDRYELAEMDVQTIPSVQTDGGFVPPTLIAQPGESIPERPTTPPAPSHLEAPEDIDATTAVTQGAGSVGIKSGSDQKAVSQYTLVFEDPSLGTKWFRILRWLKSDPAYDGDTVAERVINFFDAHADYE